MYGDDDLRHLHTMTSPAAETMIDSVLDSAKEHRLAKLDRTSELSLLDEDDVEAEIVVGTFRLLACAIRLLFAVVYPGVLGGKPRGWSAALPLLLRDDG